MAAQGIFEQEEIVKETQGKGGRACRIKQHHFF